MVQHVNCVTRGVNTRDLAYTNLKDVFRVAQCPHLGANDHLAMT